MREMYKKKQALNLTAQIEQTEQLLLWFSS